MSGRNKQAGYALVEILMAVALSSIILTGIGTTLRQFILVGDRGAAQLSILHSVQNAGLWITRDGSRAETVDLADGAQPAGSMTVTWNADGQAHTATYTLSGTQLQRNHNGNVTTVARHVTAAGFSLGGDLITATVTSAISGHVDSSETAVYKVWLRPSGGG